MDQPQVENQTVQHPGLGTVLWDVLQGRIGVFSLIKKLTLFIKALDEEDTFSNSKLHHFSLTGWPVRRADSLGQILVDDRLEVVLPDLEVVEAETNLPDLGVPLEGQPAFASELVVLACCYRHN